MMFECVKCGQKACDHTDELIKHLEDENEKLRLMDGSDQSAYIDQLEAERDSLILRVKELEYREKALIRANETFARKEHDLRRTGSTKG